MGRAQIQRVLERHPPVCNLDTLHLNRSTRPGALLLAPLALDDRSQLPPAVSSTRGDDPGTNETHSANHDARLQQFADAVMEIDCVNRDQGPAVLREAHVVQLNAAQQRSAKRADLEGCREVLVGLADEESSQLILRPAGFDGANRNPEE